MRLTIALLSLIALVGCSESPAPTAAKPSAPTQSTAAADPALREAGFAAQAFMRAVLSGDATSAASLLTTKAAQRHAADPSALRAMGMQVERLEMGEIRLLNDAEAAVACSITETGSEPAELVCLLKREPAGWRVCGVASESGEEGPTVISFEGPSETAPAAQYVEGSTDQGEAPRTASETSEAAFR